MDLAGASMSTAPIQVVGLKTTFTNKYLSVSRIKQFEKCPLAFRFGYIDHVNGWHEKDAANFGSTLHKALELIYDWVVDEEHIGPVPDEVIIRCYREGFELTESVGTIAYTDGLELIRNYFRVHKSVDHMKVLAVEQKFEITIESDDGKTKFNVLGYMDRVDHIGPKRIRIIDYKSNRFFFTREELDTDLQFSMYGIAAKTLWPWVEEIEYGFDMLRHDIRQKSSRTNEQLNEAADYVIAMGRRIETLLDFRPKLNGLCPWCDFRESCEEYDKALKSGESTLSYLVAADDMQRVSDERERTVALERIAKRRRQEMDKIILAQLTQTEDEVLNVGELRYKATQRSDTFWPMEDTLEILVDGLDVTREYALPRVADIAKGKMDKLIAKSNLTRGKRQLLRAKLETVAEKTKGAPWVKATNITDRRG